MKRKISRVKRSTKAVNLVRRDNSGRPNKTRSGRKDGKKILGVADDVKGRLKMQDLGYKVTDDDGRVVSLYRCDGGFVVLWYAVNRNKGKSRG